MEPTKDLEPQAVLMLIPGLENVELEL